MAERGEFRNIDHARQLASFKGMRFGTITPTDIDGFVEFAGKVFVFMETKHGDAELPTGQRLALERVCDRVQAGGGEAIVLVLRKASNGKTYLLGSLAVHSRYYRGQWAPPKEPLTSTQAIERFATAKLKSKVRAAERHTADDQSIDEWLRDYEAAE